MKNFILTFGKKLYNDYFLYSIFKFIMLNANIILHLTLICLNIYFYNIIDMDIFIFGICNIMFSIFLGVSIIIHIISWEEKDYHWIFETYRYEDYFKQIENN